MTSIYKQLIQQKITCMKSGDKDTYKVINSIIAEIKNQMINNMTRDEEPSQDMVISTLKKMVKMRVDAKNSLKMLLELI